MWTQVLPPLQGEGWGWGGDGCCLNIKLITHPPPIDVNITFKERMLVSSARSRYTASCLPLEGGGIFFKTRRLAL
jgi:hypothetical protein